MRVLVHPADEGGCGFYRLRMPARYIPEATVAYNRTYQLMVQDTAGGQKVLDILDPPDADVVVWQRPLTRRAFETIQLMQARSIAVVVELDDDFQAITPDHITYKDASPLLSPQSNWRWLKKSCEIADWVTVSTPSLAQHYAPHGRVSVLPNYVPAEYLNLKHQDRAKMRIGWSGSVRTHPGDLEVTEGAIAQVLNESDARLYVVGTGEGVRQRLGYDGKIETAGWVALNRYPSALAKMDVGMVPLRSSRFNDGKSALKLCEMTALGIPCVASPTPDNLRMAKAGVGLIAENRDDWYREIRKLVDDSIYRSDIASWGRDIMADFTYEKHYSEWLDAWRCAADHRAVAA